MLEGEYISYDKTTSLSAFGINNIHCNRFREHIYISQSELGISSLILNVFAVRIGSLLDINQLSPIIKAPQTVLSTYLHIKTKKHETKVNRRSSTFNSFDPKSPRERNEKWRKRNGGSFQKRRIRVRYHQISSRSRRRQNVR